MTVLLIIVLGIVLGILIPECTMSMEKKVYRHLETSETDERAREVKKQELLDLIEEMDCKDKNENKYDFLARIKEVRPKGKGNKVYEEDTAPMMAEKGEV